MRLSWSRRNQLWEVQDFLGLTRRAAVAFLAALALIGVTLLLQNDVVRATESDIHDASIAVLGTVIGFFVVATLAVSVSLSLLQTATSMWPSSLLMTVFVTDRDREMLLQTIFMAFVVSLANLVLLAVDEIHPILALAIPVGLAFVTLMLMIGYIHQRVRLFDAAGLTELFEHRIRRLVEVVPSLHDAKDRLDAKREAGNDLRGLAEMAKILAQNGRLSEAAEAVGAGQALLSDLVRVQIRSADAAAFDDMHWDPEALAFANLGAAMVAVGLSAHEDAVRLLEGWLDWVRFVWAPGTRKAPPAARRRFAKYAQIHLRWLLENAEQIGGRLRDPFPAVEMIATCGAVVSAAYSDRDETWFTPASAEIAEVVGLCLPLVPDVRRAEMWEQVDDSFLPAVLTLPEFASLQARD